MADDSGQGPKIASIDELVNELTKKASPPAGVGPTPPSLTVPPAGQSKPSVSVPLSQGQPQPAPLPPKPPEIVKPKFTPPPPPPTGGQVPVRPAPSAPSFSSPSRPPQPPAPPSGGPVQGAQPSPVKEYQSSIRTMGEDITRLKQGQKTAGVDISRKVEPAAPSAPATPPAAPAPAQQFKMPSVNLGQTQKASSLPQTKTPAPPPVGGKSASIPQPKTEIYAPPASARGFSGNRNLLYMVVAGAAVLFGFLYWLLIMRAPGIVDEIPTPTPTSTPTTTTIPVVTLEDLFIGPEVVVSVDPTNPADSFAKAVEATVVETGKFGRIALKDTQGADFPWSGLIDTPQQVQDSLGGEALLVVAYGQKEFFGPTGRIDPTILAKPRVVMIFEVKDQPAALQATTAWETTMTTALSKVFGLNPANQPNPNFLDNTYQGSAIRYRNFPWPDNSIDYGIISASNGKSYLVLAASREAMFASIDTLKGQ